MPRLLASCAVAAALLLATSLRAETKVTISGTHLCCGQCLKAVETTLKDIPGVTHKSSQEAKTIELTAENDEAAQKAVNALAAAGFYGKTNSDKVKYAPVDAASTAVLRLEVSGVHNCCGACTTAIKKAIGTVEGVTANTVKPREEAFVVEGKFKPADLVKALLDAGFYVQLKK
jgi:mercuric ion binding protein